MKLNIEEQLAAAKELLASQGRTTEEIDYFESAAKGLIQKVTALFAKHYSVLCGLAYEKGVDPEAKSTVNFSFATTMDLSDLDVYDLRTSITYSKSFKESTVTQGQVAEEDTQEKLPLDMPPSEGEGAGSAELPDDPNGVDPQPPDEQHPEEPALPAESPESEGTPATAGV